VGCCPFLDYIIPQTAGNVNPYFAFLRFAQKHSTI
jgi:hypothetical protein